MDRSQLQQSQEEANLCSELRSEWGIRKDSEFKTTLSRNLDEKERREMGQQLKGAIKRPQNSI